MNVRPDQVATNLHFIAGKTLRTFGVIILGSVLMSACIVAEEAGAPGAEGVDRTSQSYWSDDIWVAIEDRFVSAGNGHSCGVRTDGTVACWGSNGNGQSTAPAGTFTQVSAGGVHTCGMRTNGTVACWGYNYYGQATAPAGAFTQVTAGGFHSCGMRTDGTVACWGYDYFDQATAPTGTFTQVSAGDYHSCGTRPDGTVACWGADYDGQASPPL